MKNHFNFYTLSDELNISSIIVRLAMLKNDLIDSYGNPSQQAIDSNICKVIPHAELGDNQFLWDKAEISKIIH